MVNGEEILRASEGIGAFIKSSYATNVEENCWHAPNQGKLGQGSHVDTPCAPIYLLFARPYHIRFLIPWLGGWLAGWLIDVNSTTRAVCTACSIEAA